MIDTNNTTYKVFEMNYTEFESNGLELLIEINYSHSSHLDILKDNSTYSYSYTYSILSYALIHQCRLLIFFTIDNGSNNAVGGSCYSAHQSASRSCNTTLVWSIAFIANARLELVYRGTLITLNFPIEFWNE